MAWRCALHCRGWRRWPVYETVNAFFYTLRLACVRQTLPFRFPLRRTVFADSCACVTAMPLSGRTVSWLNLGVSGLVSAVSSAAVVDNRSVKTTEAGGLRGHDVGSKIKGRKCRAMTDTDAGAGSAGPHSRQTGPLWHYTASHGIQIG